MQVESPDMAMANLANLAKFDPSNPSFSQFSQKSHSHPAGITFAKPGKTIVPKSLERAALALCDGYGDDQERKVQMLADLNSYPPETWAWLERYFIERFQRMRLNRNKALSMHRCADCQHATITNGIARCQAGVESGLPIQGFWATDRHLCAEFQGKPAKSGSAQNSDPIPEKSTSPEPHRATKSS